MATCLQAASYDYNRSVGDLLQDSRGCGTRRNDQATGIAAAFRTRRAGNGGTGCGTATASFALEDHLRVRLVGAGWSRLKRCTGRQSQTIGEVLTNEAYVAIGRIK